MHRRTIKKVAVLGSGVMGSRIALHFAGIGLKVLLLDVANKTDENQSDSTTINKIVNDALTKALQSNPSPLYHKSFIKRITTGNFTDNMKDIGDADWIIEVVVEQLEVKQQIFSAVETYRRKGSLVTSNTSGIPIESMTEGRSDDFKKHFCGTHFFNPPRYLRLLEIIPSTFTDKAVVDFLLHYGDVFLGKTTVLCKDTPAFIANRIGVFSMLVIFRLMQTLGLSIDEIDLLTGPVIGRPKSATFRTADVVGLDTLARVAAGIYETCPHDESREQFNIPAWLKQMIQQKMLGDKSESGFFKKTTTADGQKQILVLDTDKFEYRPGIKPKFESVDQAKTLEDLKSRLKLLFNAEGKAGEFYRLFHYELFSYISHRIPEISDEIYRLDDAMMAGFGWEIGAFESWDTLGVVETAKAMKNAGYKIAPWVEEMISAGHQSFYQNENGKQLCYNVSSKKYKPVHDENVFIAMKHFENQTVWKNNVCRTYHLGDDVLGLEWYTKMGSIGSEALEGIQKSIGLAEEKYKGLVIANSGAHFSAGANLGMIFMLALEQDYDEIDMAVRIFQNTVMRLRYSSVPVVVAPHGLAVGGACELCLHADHVVAAAETYTGLVEVGLGLLPAGAGTKEFVLRAADETHKGEPENTCLQERFLTIATGKVSTSAHEAFDLGIYRKGTDQIILNQNRRIAAAKQSVIHRYDTGYVMPIPRDDIKVPGRSALGALYAGINSMFSGKYSSDHDVKVSKKIAYVMCGGDLSEPSIVTEQYLLNLEREAFLSLTGEKKTLERIQHMIKTGKILRN